MRNEIERSSQGSLPIPADEPWYPAGATAAGDGTPTQGQLWQRIHRLFRGRYLLAILLAVVCGTIGGLAGFLIAKPEWRSSGLLQIESTIPNPSGSVDEVRPMWQQFVRSQEAILQSQNIILTAMSSDEWRSTHRGMSPFEINQFTRNLNVQGLPGTSLIRVSFTDSDKEVPKLATKAVILAYEQQFADQDVSELSQKLSLNEAKRRDLQQQLRNKQNLIISYGESLGTDTPAQYVDQRLQDYARLQAQYNQAQVQYSIAVQQLASLSQAREAAATQPVRMSTAQIAAMDPRMASLLSARDEQSLQLATLLHQYLPEHPKVKDAKYRLQSLTDEIEAEADRFRKSGGGTVVNDSGQMITTQYVRSLKIRMDVLGQKVAELGRTTQDLGHIRMEIAAAKNDVESLQSQLQSVEQTIDHLTTQQSFSNKMRVISYGDTPYEPVFDQRRQYTALGAVGGAALPLAVLVLIGLIDQRYRYSDETSDDQLGGIHLLGILPNLPDLLTDPDQAAIAAHCVHQIRTMLQLGGTGQESVFAITSASPEDGKTSLSLALGLSFAASGSRTLLIDCDLVGGGLTARLNMSVETGVLEAINTRALMEFVRPTDIADLSILPVGESHTHHASSLSPAALRRLVADARKHFDTILLDTGPIQSAIEASSVCAAADGVVLVVARGQQRPQVNRALAHLHAIGAKLAGVVFNRAQPRDFSRSVNRMSVARANPGKTNGHNHDAQHTNGDQIRQFGPVTKAVANTYPPPEGESRGQWDQ